MAERMDYQRPVQPLNRFAAKILGTELNPLAKVGLPRIFQFGRRCSVVSLSFVGNGSRKKIGLVIAKAKAAGGVVGTPSLPATALLRCGGVVVTNVSSRTLS